MARTTVRAMERVSLVMSGAQLGITVASLGLGAVSEPVVAGLLEPAFHALSVPDGLLHPVAFVLALSVVAALHVVLGEMVPKNIALAGPERAAILLGPPMMLVVHALKPIVLGLNAVANGTVRLLGRQPRDDVASTFTREEVGAILGAAGIAVRAGHHCAQPTLRRFGLESTIRPSLALYNDDSDIDALVEELLRLTHHA